MGTVIAGSAIWKGELTASASLFSIDEGLLLGTPDQAFHSTVIGVDVVVVRTSGLNQT
jgi:hypothetical protein